jgi:hypothetical protein
MVHLCVCLLSMLFIDLSLMSSGNMLGWVFVGFTGVSSITVHCKEVWDGRSQEGREGKSGTAGSVWTVVIPVGLPRIVPVNSTGCMQHELQRWQGCIR